MSEATETTMNRRKLLEVAGTAAAAVAAAGLAKPAAAAEEPAPIPFKWTVSGKAEAFVIPFDPPVLSVRTIMKGASEILGGEITTTSAHISHLNHAGNFNRVRDGLTVHAGPNGDAIFVQFDGWGSPAPLTFRHGFTIVGGRGRFAGATGSGTFDVVVDPAKSEGTAVWEGVIIPCR